MTEADTISISWISDSDAPTRGYDNAEEIGEGRWVVERNGEFVAYLGEAGEDKTAGEAKYEAECLLTQGEDWTWEADSSYSPARDFTATRS